MTVATTTNTAHFSGSGSTGPFTFSFRFFENSDITVVKTSAIGVMTTLVETTDYTLSGAMSYSGGSITLVAALESGESLDVTRDLPLSQTSSIRNQGAFYPEIHEDALDRLTMQIQQVAISGSTAPIVENIDASGGDVTVTLPASGDVTITKVDDSAHTIRIEPAPGSTIGAVGHHTLSVQWESVRLIFYGTNWNTI